MRHLPGRKRAGAGGHAQQGVGVQEGDAERLAALKAARDSGSQKVQREREMSVFGGFRFQGYSFRSPRGVQT
eukprot:2795325-Prymnesium_polylepis.1